MNEFQKLLHGEEKVETLLERAVRRELRRLDAVAAACSVHAHGKPAAAHAADAKKRLQ